MSYISIDHKVLWQSKELREVNKKLYAKHSADSDKDTESISYTRDSKPIIPNILDHN